MSRENIPGEIVKIKKRKQDCIKQIASIKRQNKVSTFLVAFGVIIVIASMVTQQWGLAVFMSVMSLVNYFVNTYTYKLIPNFEGHIKNYDKLIKSYKAMQDGYRKLDEFEKSL